MQLDDVVSSTVSGPRVEEAMHRSVRWYVMTEGDKEDGCGGAVQCFVMTTNRLDRCIAAHSRPDEQNLFAIIQGGLDENLRRKCLDEMIKRDLPGYAIGGLSGGEAKVRPRRQFNLSRSSCAMVVDSAR